MRSYLVVLDGTPTSWEAAYSAFHLAARLGWRLVGLAAKSQADERTANQWLAEFETGRARSRDHRREPPRHRSRR